MKCSATTKAGIACFAPAVSGADRCFFHLNPDKAVTLGHKGGLKHGQCARLAFRTVEDVHNFLDAAAVEVHNNRLSPAVASSLADLGIALLKAIKMRKENK